MSNIVAAAVSQSAEETAALVRSIQSLEIMTVILLACPETLYQTLNPPLQTWFHEVRQPNNMDGLLAREVLKLREQMIALQELCQVQGWRVLCADWGL